MNRRKPFRELRVYAYPQRVPSRELPKECQALLATADRAVFRFGCKLKELEFELNTFSQVFLQLDIDRSEDTDPKTMADVLMSQVLQVIVGFPVSITKLDSENIEDALTRFTSRCLTKVSHKFDGNSEIVARAESQLLKWGSETRIVAAEKDTKRYFVQIFFKCEPPRSGPDNLAAQTVGVYLNFTDKKTGQTATKFLFDSLYFQLEAILGRLSIKGEILELIPKSSERAQLYLKDVTYPTSISLTLD